MKIRDILLQYHLEDAEIFKLQISLNYGTQHTGNLDTKIEKMAQNHEKSGVKNMVSSLKKNQVCSWFFPNLVMI